MLEELRPFLVALAIGLMIGIERERSKSKENISPSFGVRTLSILAILGSLAAHVDHGPIVILLCVFAAIISITGYVHKCVVVGSRLVGATTEVAAMTVFVLGYLTQTSMQLAIILGVLVLVLLAVRDHVHTFAHSGIKEKEMSAALTFLVISFVVLPILPNDYIDPWNLVNPTRIWLLFVLLAGVEFGAYITVRKFGSKWGIALTGLMGGLASATATTASLAMQMREKPQLLWMIGSGIVLAEVSSLLVQLMILSTIAHEVTHHLSPVLLAPAIIGAVLGGLSIYITGRARGRKQVKVDLDNPLTLKRTAGFALMISAVLITITLVSRFVGNDGVYVASLFGGTVSVRSVALAVATLANSGEIATNTAVLSILMAFVGNIGFKLYMITKIGGLRLFYVCAPPLILMLLSGAGALLLKLNYM